MRSRHYDRRIDVYQVSSQNDGYGGHTMTENLLFSTWAKIETMNNKMLIDYGLTEDVMGVMFKVRHRNDYTYNANNMHVVYRGDKYVIKSIENVDFKDVDTIIVCTKMIKYDA